MALAEEWDNCGLQVGDPRWPVRKLWVALDPLLEIVQAANQEQVDLIITHHPLFFKAIDHIDVQTPVGKIIAGSLRGNTAIYSAHTNLDSTFGGINDIFAYRIGLTQLTALIPAVEGFRIPDHVQPDTPYGLGRVGHLNEARTVADFAADIKAALSLKGVRVVGNADQIVQRAAVCSGSGGGLLGAFFESGADVFVSGDLKYHDARLIEDAGKAVIDVGHFASEHLIIDPLAQYLEKEVKTAGWDLVVETYRMERDPFAYI